MGTGQDFPLRRWGAMEGSRHGASRSDLDVGRCPLSAMWRTSWGRWRVLLGDCGILGGHWGSHKRPKSEVLSKTGFCDQRVTPPSLLPSQLGGEASSSLGRCFSLGLPGQDPLTSSHGQMHQVMWTDNIASEE